MSSEVQVAQRGVNFNREAQDKNFYYAFLGGCFLTFAIAVYGGANADFDFHNKLQQCQEQAKTAYKDYFGGLAVDRTLFEGEFYKSEKYIRFLQEKENFTPKLRGSISLPPSSRNWQLRFLTSENSQSFEDFLISAIGVIVGCFILSIFVGWGWISVLQVHARKFVYVTVGITPALFIVVGAYFTLNEDTKPLGAILAIFGAIIALIFVCLRSKLDLAATIISESCNALRDNKQLLTTNLKIIGVYMLVDILYFGIFVLLVLNGKPEISGYGTCVWELESLAVNMMYVVGFLLSWTAFVFMFIRVYVIGGTIGIWYFHSNDQTAVPSGSDPKLLPMQWARGPGFGTVCYAALILAIIEQIRQYLEQQKKKAGVVGAILLCIGSCIMSLIEMLSRFAVIWSSVTGDSFCDSASRATTVLKRNLLSTLVIDKMTDYVLSFSALVLAMIMGFVGMGISGFLVEDDKNKISFSLVVFLIVFFLTFLVFAFYGGMINSISDAVFLFYAIDKDNNVQGNPQAGGFHQIYSNMQVQPEPAPAQV